MGLLLPHALAPQALVRQLAAQSPFAEQAGSLASMVQLGHTLYARPGAPAIGESHAGGLPDLPADIAWPTVTRGDGSVEPLSFIGQVRLDELDSSAWRGPRKGLLSVFYASGNHRGSEDDEVARVLLLPTRDLAPRGRPSDDRDPDSAHPLHQPRPLAAQRWQPRVTASIPSPGADALRPIGMDFEGPRGYDIEAGEELDALSARLDSAQGHDDLVETVRPGDQASIGTASFGGWPFIDQFDPLEHAADGRETPSHWMLLLQVGETLNETTAAFVIRKTDAERGDFSRVRVESW